MTWSPNDWLCDDLLSGSGLRAALSSITFGTPVIGTWLHVALFGGDFPGHSIIPRMCSATTPVSWAGTNREQCHRRARIMPVFAVKTGAFFAIILGGLGLMGGLLQINPIWQLGPYNPSQVCSGSQPDLYMMWTEGLARIWPAWEFYPFGPNAWDVPSALSPVRR